MYVRVCECVCELCTYRVGLLCLLVSSIDAFFPFSFPYFFLMSFSSHRRADKTERSVGENVYVCVLF